MPLANLPSHLSLLNSVLNTSILSWCCSLEPFSTAKAGGNPFEASVLYQSKARLPPCRVLLQPSRRDATPVEGAASHSYSRGVSSPRDAAAA